MQSPYNSRFLISQLYKYEFNFFPVKPCCYYISERFHFSFSFRPFGLENIIRCSNTPLIIIILRPIIIILNAVPIYIYRHIIADRYGDNNIIYKCSRVVYFYVPTTQYIQYLHHNNTEYQCSVFVHYNCMYGVHVVMSLPDIDYDVFQSPRGISRMIHNSVIQAGYGRLQFIVKTREKKKTEKN